MLGQHKDNKVEPKNMQGDIVYFQLKGLVLFYDPRE